MMARRVIHHGQAPPTGEAIRADPSYITVAFPGQDQARLDIRTVRQDIGIKGAAAMSTLLAHEASR